MWREIKNIIDNSKRFILTTHVNPDGDGIGTACALIELLLAKGKEVRFVCDSPMPKKFSFLDFHHLYEPYCPESNYSDADVLIILDAHRKERIGRMATLLDHPSLCVICIDHHEIVEHLTPYLAIDPKACCVGALIYDLFEEYQFPLNLNAAMGIYTSILCDTGRFCYSSTGLEAHKIAEECIKLGVDPDGMYSRLFQHVPLSEVKMFAKALETMEIYLDNRVIIEKIRLADCENTGTHPMDLEHIDLDYIHDFNKLIEDVECVVLLRELPEGQVRVSLRSTSNLDVGKLLLAAGGGGHSRAAGAIWQGSLLDAKKRILILLQEAFASDLHKLAIC